MVLGRTGKDLGPVKALLNYLQVRGMEPGPLFHHNDGRVLLKPIFIRWVQQALAKLGYDQKEFTGHSFRVGAATTAAKMGIQDSLIKALGRWESSAYLLYIHIPAGDLQQVASKILDGP